MLTIFQFTKRGTANVLTKESTTDKKEDSTGFEMTAFCFTERPSWIKSSEYFYSENVDGTGNREYQNR